jgi:hypothetical protein
MQTPDTSTLIDALGGNKKVAKTCDISEQAVSQWRKRGMPKPWQKFFKQRNPKLFNQFQGEAHVTPS